MGAKDEEITLDIAVCYGGKGTIPPSETLGNSISNYLSAREIRKWYGSSDSINEELLLASGATVRYFFQEGDPLALGCDLSELNFNGDATWCL